MQENENEDLEKEVKLQATIYHELGHIVGYCLGNSSDKTKLGLIKQLIISLKANACVVPEILSYHYNRERTNCEEVKLNLNNRPKTIAWIIEVLLGCIFETRYKNIDFRYCFNKSGNGNIDLENLDLAEIRSKNVWQSNLLEGLRNDLIKLVENFEVINILQPMVEKLKKEIENDGTQIDYQNEKIIELYKSVLKLIPFKLIDKYHELVEKYQNFIHIR